MQYGVNWVHSIKCEVVPVRISRLCRHCVAKGVNWCEKKKTSFIIQRQEKKKKAMLLTYT